MGLNNPTLKLQKDYLFVWFDFLVLFLVGFSFLYFLLVGLTNLFLVDHTLMDSIPMEINQRILVHGDPCDFPVVGNLVLPEWPP